MIRAVQTVLLISCLLISACASENSVSLASNQNWSQNFDNMQWAKVPSEPQSIGP